MTRYLRTLKTRQRVALALRAWLRAEVARIGGPPLVTARIGGPPLVTAEVA